MDTMDKSYFAKDRQKQLKNKMDEVIALLDSKPVEFGTLDI